MLPTVALKVKRTDCICHQNKLRHVQLLTVSFKKHHASASLMQQPICCTGCTWLHAAQQYSCTQGYS